MRPRPEWPDSNDIEAMCSVIQAVNGLPMDLELHERYAARLERLVVAWMATFDLEDDDSEG